MQQILQLTTKYTVAEMTVFNRIANKIYPNKRAQRFRILYFVLGFFGLFVSVMTYREGGALWLALMAFLIGIWYLIAAVWHYRIMGRQSFKARPEGVELMRFTFDKSGMIVENALGHSRFTFEEVVKIAEGKTLFVFFTSTEQRQGFLVPKHILEDVEGFRTMVKSQYPCGIETFNI